ncbi:protein Diedel-like [Acyrthosiphon pisum]|uniref:Uncharacterized protein n=1 Tax=Acyrthosiphon pisum TaxID=7029 RepID=A0A8R2B9H9_ACYPI|nr:protein Diedel-like [Acyrthosiphon pisum]|eukprot:XP_008187455.1 PREDICTED: uncharacterized protein LOC103310562 [Acyrthosiphon pisum]
MNSLLCVSVSLLLVLLQSLEINSECCNLQSSVKYTPKGDYTCEEAVPMGQRSLLCLLPRCCVVNHMCHDAKVYPGFYCSSGTCNAVGCNCDGPCIDGDHKTLADHFRLLYPNAEYGYETVSVKNTRAITGFII